MSEVSDQQLRVMHRKRIKAWGVAVSESHEDEVVARALRALEGRESRPLLHAHALEEMGMCVECDAAALLDESEAG